MTEALKIALEVIKLAPRFIIAIGFVAGVLLFSSDSALKTLGVFDITQKYRPWIGLTFIAAVALFAISAAIFIFNRVAEWWYGRKLYQLIQHRLHNLTEDEKQILRFYYQHETKTNVLRYDDGVVQGLASAGIIYRSSQMGNLVEGFAYNISDYAWNYLWRHQYLLQGTTNTYRTDKRPGMW